MKHACAGCKGTGTFTSSWGTITCKGCDGSGSFSYRWLLVRCHECGGLGSSMRVLQGERDLPDGSVEFFPECSSFACHLCHGRGFLPWIPGQIMIRRLCAALLVPVVAALTLLRWLENFLLRLFGKPSATEIQPTEISSFVSDPRSGHQLVLSQVPQGKGYDFESLLWCKPPVTGKESLEASIVVAKITRSAFQAGRERERWVSDVHSFNSSTGRAIIQVAEADVPMNHPPGQEVNIQYSWWEWSIPENRELRHLATCKLPSDEFPMSAV